jgi:hypothetical protein
MNDRRGLFLWVIVGVLIFVSIGTALYAWWAWSWYPDFDKQVEAVTMVLTGAALLVAVLAGTVAIAAYWLAIQRPKLELDVSFGHADTFEIRVRLWNRNSYSARNPAVRMEFFGLQPVASGHVNWLTVPVTQSGAVGAIQWDGGADLSIHGPDWFRDLPPFNLGPPRVLAGAKPTLYVEAVADGHRTHTTVSIP